MTAEQLAPFLDVPADSSILEDTSAYVDESFVMPIVSKLGGVPEVVGEDIVYVFPELQKTGLGKAALSKLMNVQSPAEYETASAMRENVDLPVDIVEEAPWKFSSASTTNQALAGGLGAVNLGGALYLGSMLSSPSLQGVVLPSYFGLVQAALPFLTVYAVMYNVIPAARFFWIKKENAKIEGRNSVRRVWRDALQRGGDRVARKLRAARGLQSKVERLGAEGAVYETSDRGSEEEAARAQKKELEEFDRRIGK